MFSLILNYIKKGKTDKLKYESTKTWCVSVCALCVYVPGLTPAVWPGRSRQLRLGAGRYSHARVSVPVTRAPPSSGR